MSNIRISELATVTDLTLEGVLPLSQKDPNNNDIFTTYKTTLQQVFDLFSALFPTGLILPYGGKDVSQTAFDTTLKGWKLCNGDSLTISNYTALYAAIGDTYGASTATIFKLPDLRGRTLIGAGQGLALSVNYILGDSGGAESVGLAQQNIPYHAHGYEIGQQKKYGTTSGNETVLAAPVVPSSTNTFTGGTQPNGLPHPNMQPYTVINYIIKT